MSDAVKYFQKNGLEASKQIVEMGFGFCSLERGLSFHTEQLKQLVESHERVAKQGGLVSARKYVKFLQSSVDRGLFHGLDGFDYKIELPLMKQAIADVEGCQGVLS